MEKILVAEDDELLNEGICFALRKAGYEVYSARKLEQIRGYLNQGVDLMILDVSLPDGDSRAFLAQLRQDNDTPAVFLTARKSEQDLLKGFDSGGDDYMTKPFSVPVLLRRVQAVLKRRVGQGQFYYSDDLVYDFRNQILKRSGQEIPLTPTEKKIMEVFLNNRNQVLTREVLLARVWDVDENFVDEKTLNVNVRRMREKIEANPKDPRWIHTVFGIGYKWRDDNG
ncbi:MAG: response regulator transcription factor [Eubacteriales bacterium]|nr:response regulator transcription factor [Eubacteriales bacterium]